MTALNGTRLPRLLFGLVVGTAAIALGANAVAQDSPAEVPAAIGAEAEESTAADEKSVDEQGLGHIYAIVDGVPVTEADLAIFAQDYSQQLGQMPPEMRIPELLNGVIEMRLLAQAAEAAGLDKDDITMRRLASARSGILSSEYLRQSVVDAVSDETVRARFDKEMSEFESDDEFRLRHILVESEEEARAIIAEIDGGGDFAAIAKEKSKDPRSGANGGDLDFMPKGRTVAEFENAALALELGQYTKDPVQTQFGWHVILLEEKRKTVAPEFATEEPRIQSDLIREFITDTVGSLRSAAEIEFLPPPEPSTADGGNTETNAQ